MRGLGFARGDSDPCLFIKGNVLMGLHVDDGLLVGPEKEVNATVRQIANRITIKDEGFLVTGKTSVFLGIELMLIPQKGLLLKEERYTRDLLQKYKMDDMSSSDVVMRERKQEEEPIIQGNIPYASMVGALLYLATHTRPEIAFSVGVKIPQILVFSCWQGK